MFSSDDEDGVVGSDRADEVISGLVAAPQLRRSIQHRVDLAAQPRLRPPQPGHQRLEPHLTDDDKVDVG
jgi:hypothetical protein